MPVAVTTIAAVPRVTAVFWNSMFVRSPTGVSSPVSAAASLATGALSPVSAASCVSSVAERTIRPSAGTMSPASSCTRSPGTTSVAGMSARAPSRTTFACGTWRLASASMLARACSSCRVPRTTLSRIRSATITAVDTSPITQAHHGDRDEHQAHGLPELGEGHLPGRGRRLGRDLVGPLAGEPRGRLARGQARRAVGPHLGHAPPRPRGRAARSSCGAARVVIEHGHSLRRRRWASPGGDEPSPGPGRRQRWRPGSAGAMIPR